jgi:ABC-2 type transport system permease protein
MAHVTYNLRVIWACMNKDIQSALTQRIGTILGVLLPVNFLILMSLFALSGAQAPTAVVMHDTGPYARAFYDAMAHAHSFRLQTASAQEAQDLIQAGKIVAVVTIPADFDTRVQQNQRVAVAVQINNLNTDFTNDIRRAVPLSITIFYGKVFPHLVTVTMSEHDLHAQDTDYIPYLTVSIVVVALLVGGLLQAGVPAAAEWEQATIKEVLLSPASRFAVMVGKMAGALVIALASMVVVLATLILLFGVWPLHFWEAIGATLLVTVIFIAAGTLLGTLLKRRQAFAALAIASSIPVFFISGAFGPLSFGNNVVLSVLAQLFPMYYAIVFMQHAFHGFDLNTYGLGTNVLILCGYALALIVGASLVLRRSTVAS